MPRRPRALLQSGHHSGGRTAKRAARPRRRAVQRSARAGSSGPAGWGCSTEGGSSGVPWYASNVCVRSDSFSTRSGGVDTASRAAWRSSARVFSLGRRQPGASSRRPAWRLDASEGLGGGTFGLALLCGGMARGAGGGAASAGVVVAVVGRQTSRLRGWPRLGKGVARVWRGRGLVLARGRRAVVREMARLIARDHVGRDLQRVGTPTLDRLVGL